MTPVKKWPTQADWARMDSISIQRKIRELVRIARERTTDPLVMRTLAQVSDCAYETELTLLKVGAHAEKMALKAEHDENKFSN